MGTFTFSDWLLGEDWFRLWFEDFTRAEKIVGVTSCCGLVKIDELPELLEKFWILEELIGLDFMQLDPIYGVGLKSRKLEFFGIGNGVRVGEL